MKNPTVVALFIYGITAVVSFGIAFVISALSRLLDFLEKKDQ